MLFTGLDPTEKYFPMVARAGTGTSICGSPPAPVSPASRSETSPILAHGCCPSICPANSSPRDSPSPIPSHMDEDTVNHASPQRLDESPHSQNDSPVPAHRTLNMDEDALERLKKYDDQWRKWHQEELPKTISQLFKAPTAAPRHQVKLRPRGTFHHRLCFCVGEIFRQETPHATY